MNNPIESSWIKANAGSGKTTRLTDRVLRLLVLGVPAERIVCLTYTKAAASEMRTRVLAGLRALLLMDDAACREKIGQLLGGVPTELHQQRARRLFSAVLDSPGGGVQLTTIHGFCQNILRRFPLEAGLAPHFSVLEEAAAGEMLHQARHALLRSGAHHASLGEALGMIGARGGEARFNALTGEIIRQKALWKRVWHLQSPESLRAHLWRLHGLASDISAAALGAMFLGALRAQDEALLRGHLPQMLSHKTKSYRLFAEKMAAWLALDAPVRAQRPQQLVESLLAKSSLKPAQYMLDKKQHPEGSPLQEALGNWVALAQQYQAQMAALACAEESYAVALVARALEQHYSAAKEAQHALDYDDLIARTLELCTRPEMVGWVMSKLDHRIDHLLIDEAQDNSLAQWQLAQVLVEELMAGNAGPGSANLPRSLLVVGDEKQSIYSFQGAAPEAFSHYQGIVRALLAHSHTPLREETLAHSYRSTQAVLRVVDAVCAQPMIARAISADGQTTPHLLTRSEAAGCVVLYPPVLAPEKPETAPLTLPLEYHLADSAAQLLADSIAGTIAQWLEQKRPLAGAGRAVEAGDILILVRNRTRLVPTLIRTLQRRGIPVAGIDRLTLADHLAVGDLLALMRWCGHTGDDLALAQVLRSPLVGMGDEELRALAYGRAGSLWAQVQNPWLEQVLGWRALSPYDFLTQVLEVSNRRQDFARRFGEEVHEVLDELKAQAASMPAGMPQTLAQFREWIERSARQIKREQENAVANQVRIMTVHGAKGLEAPVVLLADTVDVPTTQRETFFAITAPEYPPLLALSISESSKSAPRLMAAKEARRDAILAEYYRLLYVALTRARDELHVFGSTGRKGTLKQGSWYEAIAVAMQESGATPHEDGSLWLVNAGRAAPPQEKDPPPALPAPRLPAWANAPVVMEAAAARLSPSRLEVAATGPYAPLAGRDARERGVRIHRVLELLDAHSDAACIAQWVHAIATDWDAAEQAAISAQIAALHAQEHWLWEHPRLPEVSVSGTVTHGGRPIAVSGQIDLLIETPGEIIILDYKTGAGVPKDSAGVALSYLLQLKLYHALVSQIYPDLPVRCAILWTQAPTLMWLDEAVKNAEFPDKNVMPEAGVAA
ncbi:MAG: UvrD-helicase domain-containing protein [Alphaproteobacteria bacterium]|nr:UvrD-helicase domain-containing protein [Alphaproteobacteria bacterium]